MDVPLCFAQWVSTGNEIASLVLFGNHQLEVFQQQNVLQILLVFYPSQNQFLFDVYELVPILTYIRAITDNRCNHSDWYLLFDTLLPNIHEYSLTANGCTQGTVNPIPILSVSNEYFFRLL